MGNSNVIALSDFTLNETLNALPKRYQYNRKEATKVYHSLIKSGIKYNVKSGFTTDNSGHLSNFRSPSDIPMYTDKLEAFEDNLMPWVCNGISRILNGFDNL